MCTYGMRHQTHKRILCKIHLLKSVLFLLRFSHFSTKGDKERLHFRVANVGVPLNAKTKQKSNYVKSYMHSKPSVWQW